VIVWYGLGIILCLIASCEYYTWKTGVPTVTSLPSARKKMIELLAKEAAQHKAADRPFIVLDLGSGTGKLALEIGKALPSAQVTGLEISLVPYLISRLRCVLWRVKNVTFKREDFWPYLLADVDAVAIYMNGNIRERMAQKLQAELPPGAMVISNETHLTGSWTPVEVHEVGLLHLKVVVYRQVI